MSEKKHLVLGPYDWPTLTGDVKACLEKLRENGATGIRAFALYVWGFENPCTPFKKIRTWDPGWGIPYPFYSLLEKNQEYFDKVSEIKEWTKEIGLERWVALHDNCSYNGYVEGRPLCELHPFWANIQKKDPDNPRADSKIAGGVFGLPASWQTENDTMQKYHRLYFQWMLDVWEPDYVEPVNEYSRHHDMSNEHLIKWHEWAVGALLDMGVSKERLVASAEKVIELDIAKQVGIYSYHCIARPEKLPVYGYPILCAPDCKALISSDGAWDGDGPRNSLGQAGPSAQQAKQIAEKIKECNYLGYELLPKMTYGGHQQFSNVDLIVEELPAIRAMGEVFGTIPMPPEPVFISIEVCNKTGLIPNKWCRERVVEKFEIGDEPREQCSECKASCSYYFKRLNFRRWLKCIFS